MSVFPETPTMLLTRIAMRISGEDEAVWTEFFELYEPAMRTYLLGQGRRNPGSTTSYRKFSLSLSPFCVKGAILRSAAAFVHIFRTFCTTK